MPLTIIRNDITTMAVDAIVSAANTSLRGGGGVDGAIRAAAGPELAEACRALGGCRVGEARLTKGYRLPCRYIIHTVGPRWRGGLFGERRQLASCYREALTLAAENGCETVAFPLISAGTYGYPKDQAMKVALDTIGDYLLRHDMTVYLVLFGQESTALGRKLGAEIREYIDGHYVSEHRPPQNRRERDGDLTDREAFEAAFDEAFMEARPQESAPCPPTASEPLQSPRDAAEDTGRWDTAVFLSAERTEAAPKYEQTEAAPAKQAAAPPAQGGSMAGPGFPGPMASARAPMPYGMAVQDTTALEQLMKELDESFQQMLLRKIDESGMTDAQCYKKANIDRKLFSKIRNDVQYKPKKTTAIAFAVALELDMNETEELLRKAGYALSNSRKFDVIISYFIEHRKYNIFEINETLFYYDQSLLGA